MLDKTAEAALGFWHRLQSVWFRWAEYNQHHPMFLVFVSLLVAIDAIVIVLPGDVVLILAVLSNPSKWKRIWLAGAVGGIIGGMALVWMVQSWGAEFFTSFAQSLGAGSNIEVMQRWFNEYGLVTIAVGSCIPGASWTPVLLAGLAGSPLGEVFAWLVLGRTVRYFIFCFGTREGWAVFHTIREKAKAEKERSEILAKDSSPSDEKPRRPSIQ